MEEEESSEGEDVEAFVGPVGQPICPLRAQIDLPRRTVIECLQAIVSTLIPLTPPQTLETRAQITTGLIVITLRAQATCDSNMPSD